MLMASQKACEILKVEGCSGAAMLPGLMCCVHDGIKVYVSKEDTDADVSQVCELSQCDKCLCLPFKMSFAFDTPL